MKDFYYILGIHKNASLHEIKSAYRKLALKFHPDKNGSDAFFEERFRDVKEAYETLSNDIRRKEHDLRLGETTGGLNLNKLKKYEDDLRKKYENALREKENEIKSRYRSLILKSREETEKKKKEEDARKKADGARFKAEEKRLLDEIASLRKALAQREKKIRLLGNEIASGKKELIPSNRHINLLTYMLDNASGDKGDLFPLHEIPEILKEMEKIRTLVPADEIPVFLKMLVGFSSSRSIPARYSHDYPHLVRLIMKETIGTKPFKSIYAKHRSNPAGTNDFSRQLLMYFHLPAFNK